MGKDRPPREGPPYLFIERPRCPNCGSLKLRTYRTSRHGDDSLTRHAACADCGQKVLIVLE